MSKQKPTIKDIAERCGVSKTTVSFVFNNPERVAAGTRKRVEQVAAEMGYSPDPSARNLATRRTGSLGFLLPEVTPEGFKNPFLFLLLQGMRIGCMSTGYTLNVLSPPNHHLLSTLQNTAMDGVIILGTVHDEAVFHYLAKRHLPIVSLDGGVKENIPSIISDDEVASEIVMTEILNQGHRRIMDLTVAGGGEEIPGYSPTVIDKRLEGHSRAVDKFLAAHPQEADKLKIETVICSECSAPGGREGFEKNWRQGITAVISFSDIMALGVFEACRDKKLAIPGDISLVGFDDIHEASLLTPQLTTVHQPAMAKGEKAVHLLVDQILGKPIESRTLPTHFLLRESLGPAPQN